MKFFVDTADLGELREAAALGVVDGVTTNPSLVAKTGLSMLDAAQQISKIIQGPISIETISSDRDGMIAEGRGFAAVHKNIVVKCPMTEAGIAATKVLASEGIAVNVTLVFSPVQGLLAAKAGAAYVSPFIGRVDDVGLDGMQLIRDLVLVFKNYSFKTEILAASIRHPAHVLECAKAGAHVATLPLKILKQLYQHPQTREGLEKFLSDWKQSKKS